MNFKKKEKVILFFLIGIFFLTFITAVELDVGGGLQEQTPSINQVRFTIPDPRINVTTTDLTFNKSDIWVTNEGNMDNIPDLYPTLDLKYLELDGSNANTNIDISSFNFSAGFFLGNTITPILPQNLVNKDYVDDATSSTAFDFFFNNETSNFAGHFNMTESDLGRPENSLDSASLGTGIESIFNFTSIIRQPEFNELRQGVYDVHIHLNVDGAGRKPVTITPKLYNISSDGLSRTLIVEFETSDILTVIGMEYDLHGVLSNPIMLPEGNRLNLELEATIGSTGANPVVTITLEGTTDSHLSIQTSTNAFEKIFIRRDGTNTLTGNWQYDSPINPFNFNGTGDFTTTGNISADTLFGDWNGSGDFWANDGSSTATGNWNIGFQTFTTSNIGDFGGVFLEGVSVLESFFGTRSLHNINVIDTTTETTIENAIDTLSNLALIDSSELTIEAITNFTDDVNFINNRITSKNQDTFFQWTFKTGGGLVESTLLVDTNGRMIFTPQEKFQVTTEALFDGQVTIGDGNPAGKLFIDGGFSGETPSQRGSEISFNDGTVDGTPTGYIFVNNNNQLVFSESVQGSSGDEGNAWIGFDGSWSLGPGTFAADIDGGDVSLTIENLALGGSDDESVSLIFETHAVGADPKIRVDREGIFTSPATAIASMSFFTVWNNAEVLALKIDENQNFDFQTGDVTMRALNVTVNMTMKSADGSEWSCGPNDLGVLICG